MTDLLLRVSIDRNHELYKEAKAQQQLKLDEANKPKTDPVKEARRQRTLDILFGTGAFIVSFAAVKLILDRRN